MLKDFEVSIDRPLVIVLLELRKILNHLEMRQMSNDGIESMNRIYLLIDGKKSTRMYASAGE